MVIFGTNVIDLHKLGTGELAIAAGKAVALENLSP
jgi:hypothetical protein